jgi:uncharacterized protein YyaL (SSP411 family)
MHDIKKANRLIQSTSPYLLQHAYNPVDWFEWGEEALAKAKNENKPILVSIGYSSCHWCHVMEREAFEKEDIATIMNEYLVCIKVDREERPDVDQIYMEAVQAMGVHGGWPLNVFLTPEQKPFYGGTYYPPQQWVQVITSIHNAFNSKRNEIEESANELTHILAQQDSNRFKKTFEVSELKNDLELIYGKLEPSFDKAWGGLDKAPKFVMPSIWLWLLRYHHLSKNEKALQQILITLKRISWGGIYDQVGGGFARYSVDKYWFAPHFEKMLYDNAQLMSLYAEAYAVTKDEEFKTILSETFEWLQSEMMHPDGGFYSALDADSEGEEGKFYVWTKKEFKEVLSDEAELIGGYYSIKEEGNWEHGNNILMRTESNETFLRKNDISVQEFSLKLRAAKDKLLEVRDKRIKPGLDDKIITSWNAMMIVGLTDAYKATGNEKFLKAAIKNMQFLEKELTEKSTLYRSYKNKRSNVKGFLDDYAYMIQANIKLYHVTFDESFIKRAKILNDHVLENFFDPSDGFFHYAGKDSEKLIASRKELFDNVIPASNSVMVQNLFHLGILFDLDDLKKLAENMTMSLSHLIKSEPNYMSNWAIAYTEIRKGMVEVVFAGDIDKSRKEFQQQYQPFAVTIGVKEKSDLPLTAGKISIDQKPTLYVCYDKSCQRPVHHVEEAIGQIISSL